MQNTPNKDFAKKSASDAVFINYLKLKTDELMLKTAVLSKKNKNMAIYLRQNLAVEVCDTCLGDGEHTWLAPTEPCESCKGVGFISVSI